MQNSKTMSQHLADLVQQSLDQKRITPRSVALRAGLPYDAIYRVLMHEPKLNRAAAVCEALGLEFYIGTRRDTETISAEQPPSTERQLEDKLDSLQKTVFEGFEKIFKNSNTDVYVPHHDVRASAGPGAAVAGEDISKFLVFQRGWLHKLGLNPNFLSIIEVAGDSMVPTLAEGTKILIDHSSVAPQSKNIYVIRIDNDLVVKRLVKTQETWRVVSDNPDYSAFDLLPYNHQIIGRVAWMSRTF